MVPELGVIEGYFGRPWQHADRKQVMSRLRELGYGFFHFAPKADAFLRRRWREPHPDAALAELTDLSAHCRGIGLRFGVGLSPYELYRDFGGPDRAAFIDQGPLARLRSASTIWRSSSTTPAVMCPTSRPAKPRSCTPRWNTRAPAAFSCARRTTPTTACSMSCSASGRWVICRIWGGGSTLGWVCTGRVKRSARVSSARATSTE